MILKMVRVRNRYFLIEIVCTDFLEQTLLQLPFSSKDIQTKIMTAMEKIFGDYGAAVLRSGLNVKIFNKYTRIAYLRCRRDPHEMLASVLPFITEIGGVKCFIRTLHLAGSIRSCHKFLRSYHHRKMITLLSMCSSAAKKFKIQESIRASMEGMDELDKFVLSVSGKNNK